MTISARLRKPFAGICCVAAMALASTAHAQQNSMFGGAGPTSGSSGFGTASTGASFGVGSSAGGISTSAFPGGQVGNSGSLQTGGLGMGLGTPGGVQQPGQTQRTGMVGQQNTRFTGMAQAQQNQPGALNQMNRQGQNRANAGRRTGQNQNQANQANQQGAGNMNPQRTIRPQLIVAFSAPRPTVQRSAVNLATRFDKLAGRAGFENVTVETEGGKLILRGQVNSAETSRVAAALARMEPGVRSVQNELKVKSAPVSVGE
jgi:hypothetical protein